MAEDGYEAAEETSGDAGARLDELSAKLKGWFKEDIEHVSDWRKQAREDFEFYSGEQWSEEDKRVLNDQKRPAMTFNRVAPLVNAVVGAEINNRREVQYIPRELGDAQANEVLTAAGEWFRDQTGAEDEESDAFEDAVICGMGWTDTRMDFEEEPDGVPKIARLDPLKMAWDCNASKPNLEDARRLWYIDEKPLSEVREMFPKVTKEDLHAGWAKALGNDPSDPHDQDQADLYNGEQDDYASGGAKQMCTLVECRWVEREPYYRALVNGQIAELTEEQFQEAAKLNIQGVRQYRKVVKRAFIGRTVLAEPDQPLVPPGMFGWECVTGYRDKIKGQFYGVVRTAKDPQRWSNKFFSQVMHLLNSQSKGGIMAERGAFENDHDAEQSWAKADSITYVKKGALQGQNPQILPKPVAQFPAGFFTLFQESKEAITQVTGLSPEFLGTREVDQAGVLEYQRRQSSLNLLASLFNSLRRYRKRQGKVMLHLIQNHLADGRLVRIVGDDKAEYVPLMREQVADQKYDIIIDDAPNSPNEKERTWQILQALLPMVKELVTPDVMLDILPYTPLPASFVDKLKQRAKEQAEQPQPPSPEEVKAQAEAQKVQMNLQADQQKMAMDAEKGGIELFLAQQEAALEQERMAARHAFDMRKLALEERKAEIQAEKANTARTNSAAN